MTGDLRIRQRCSLQLLPEFCNLQRRGATSELSCRRPCEPWLLWLWVGSRGVGPRGRPVAFAHVYTLLARYGVPRALALTISTTGHRRGLAQADAGVVKMIELYSFNGRRFQARSGRDECRRDSHSRRARWIGHGSRAGHGSPRACCCSSGAHLQRVRSDADVDSGQPAAYHGTHGSVRC